MSKIVCSRNQIGYCSVMSLPVSGGDWYPSPVIIKRKIKQGKTGGKKERKEWKTSLNGLHFLSIGQLLSHIIRRVYQIIMAITHWVENEVSLHAHMKIMERRRTNIIFKYFQVDFLGKSIEIEGLKKKS